MNPQEIIEKLKEGSRRYAEGEPLQVGELPLERRIGLVEEPQPFAVILGCSDSRVPVELVFDQGPGELYVVRSAGGGAGPCRRRRGALMPAVALLVAHDPHGGIENHRRRIFASDGPGRIS